MYRLQTSSRRTFWIALAAAVVGTNCGPGVLKDPLVAGSKYGSVVRLTVQNNDFKDAAIYAIWDGGTRRRLGLATGKASTTFTFDWVSYRVEFEADFIAGERFFADSIDVWAGDHLDLVIMDQG